MECPLCGYQKTHEHGKTSNVVNDIIILNAYKLSPILLTLCTIVEQFKTLMVQLTLRKVLTPLRENLKGVSKGILIMFLRVKFWIV